MLLPGLANMGDDAVNTFRGKWWHLYHHPRLHSEESLLRLRDELRLLWLNVSELPSEPKIPPRAKDLFENWTPTERTLKEHICEHWLEQKGCKWKVEWSGSSRKLSPNPSFLPGMLVSGCLEFGDRLAYCWNPACAAPFFIGDRIGRKYCSPACAEPANRAAKRKWWNENRGKKSQRSSPKRMT